MRYRTMLGRRGVLPLLLLLALLAACSTSNASGNQQPNASTLPYTVTVAAIREFPVLTPQSGLMRPAVDSMGNIWFGEMAGNKLGRLNPHTGQVQEWQPPHADYGIMGIVADKQGHVWFAEQNAGYIGEVSPTTTPPTFKIFPTP